MWTSTYPYFVRQHSLVNFLQVFGVRTLEGRESLTKHGSLLTHATV